MTGPDKLRGAGMQVVAIEYGLPTVTEPLRTELGQAEAVRVNGAFWVERDRGSGGRSYTLMADGVYVSVLRWTFEDPENDWCVCVGGSVHKPGYSKHETAMLAAIPIAHRELTLRASRAMAQAVVAQDALRKVVIG